MEPWLTVTQVAEILQLHPETVRDWLRAGRIPATLLSRRAGYRVRPRDLEAFLAQQPGQDWRADRNEDEAPSP